jgi:hypothetical protein
MTKHERAKAKLEEAAAAIGAAREVLAISATLPPGIASPSDQFMLVQPYASLTLAIDSVRSAYRAVAADETRQQESTPGKPSTGGTKPPITTPTEAP